MKLMDNAEGLMSEISFSDTKKMDKLIDLLIDTKTYMK